MPKLGGGEVRSGASQRALVLAAAVLQAQRCLSTSGCAGPGWPST